MPIQQTLSIIKPNAVAQDHIGEIYARFEKSGLHVVAAKMIRLSRERAEAFYGIHKDRPFFNDLVEFMISGPIMVQVLQGRRAIERHRRVMGATNPAEAEPGTIRADFGESVSRNAVHGSDGPETAKAEIAFFFHANELFLRDLPET